MAIVKFEWKTIKDRDGYYALRGIGLSYGRTSYVWLPKGVTNGEIEEIKEVIEKIWKKTR